MPFYDLNNGLNADDGINVLKFAEREGFGELKIKNYELRIGVRC